ncbi:hypothetical protein SteCoe_8111 [Stentor coeruleus]|uniref:RING-type domain-containing protein n=1 Tax=Stentor coeruleus TaxID=5963 RepID=A0A1R2CKW6_9CILI|nr:hypothetical protein SteCoe_8111 [Stentor coeruleus]
MENCTTKCTLCFSAGLYYFNPENYHKVCKNHLRNCDKNTSILCLHCKDHILVKNQINSCCSQLNNDNEALQDSEILNINDSSNFSICNTSSHYCANVKFPKDDNLYTQASESEIKLSQSVNMKSISNCDACQKKNCQYYIEEDEKYRKCSEIKNIISQSSYTISQPIQKIGNESLLPNKKFINCCNHEYTTSSKCKNLKIINNTFSKEKQNNECLNRQTSFEDAENVLIANDSMNELKKTCPTCGNLCSELIYLDCEHLRCLECINITCKACTIIKNFSKECYYCKNKFQNTQKLDCTHEICQECYEYNTFTLPSCKHIQCMICCQNNASCVKCPSIFGKLCMPYACNNVDEVKKCYSCSKTSTTLRKNLCSHDICHQCFQEKKLCKICYSSDPCSNCNSIFLVNKAKCEHFLCSKCLATISCKECTIKNLSKTCSSCKKTTKCSIRDCQHFICDKCNEEKLKCFECENRDFEFCGNCGEKTTINNMAKKRCGHYGCQACNENNECYSCISKIASRRNFKDCSRCKKNVKAYVYLRCKHILCVECFGFAKRKLKILNFSCIDCIQNTEKSCNQICSICKIESQWYCEEKFPNLVNKICCDKVICLKCADTVSGNDHSCSLCVMF